MPNTYFITLFKDLQKNVIQNKDVQEIHKPTKKEELTP